MKLKNRTGERRRNNQGLWMTVVEYENSKRMLVRFDDTGELKVTRWDSFDKGRVAADLESFPRASRSLGCWVAVVALATAALAGILIWASL